MLDKTSSTGNIRSYSTGMLWFDNTPKSTEQKIREAAEYYAKKYQLTPNLALVHPSMIQASAEQKTILAPDAKNAVITVETTKSVIPNHIWIGVKPS